MMDFEELDRLQEVLEPALLEIFRRERAPEGLAERCRELGLVTCEGFFEAIDTRRLHKDYGDDWWGSEEIYEGLVRLARELEPPAAGQRELLRLRDVWRGCRGAALAERERREAERRSQAEEEAARRAQEAERLRERAREAGRRAAERRLAAEQRAQEAKEAEKREKEAVWQKQLEIKLQAAARPTLRGLVVPASRAQDLRREGEGRAASAGAALRLRLSELAGVLSERYWGTAGRTAPHVLDDRIGRLSDGNLTVGYSAIWGLEVTEEPCGRRAVRLAREEVLAGGLVEVCPLLRAPAEADSRDQPLRSGALGRHAIWQPASAQEVLLPLGFGSLYRQSAEAWNVAPSVSGDGDELRWVAVARLAAGDELVAPAGWQALAKGGPVGEDYPSSGHVEGPALGSTRHGPSPVHRFGVFSTCAAEAGEVLDVCPALHLPLAEAQLLENYVMQFDLGKSEPTVALALGLGAVYNHRRWPQVDWLYDCETDAVVFVARQRIDPGEELFIDYGQVYFSSRGVTPSCRLADVVWRD